MRVLQILFVVTVLGMIFGTAFVGGGYLLARNVPMIVEGWQSRNWPSANGQVVESTAVPKSIILDARRGAVGTHVVNLRYKFDVDGRTFIGTRQSLDDVGIIKSQYAAQREADAMRVGSAIRVFYDASNPAKSLATPGVPIGPVIMSVVALVMIAGGVALAAVGARLRSHHANRVANRRR